MAFCDLSTGSRESWGCGQPVLPLLWMSPPNLAIPLVAELGPPSSWQVMGGPGFPGTSGIGLWGQPRGGWEMLRQQGGSLFPPLLHNLKPLPHPRSQNPSELHLPGRASPLPARAPFLPSPPTSCPSVPPPPRAGHVAGSPGHRHRSGNAGASPGRPVPSHVWLPFSFLVILPSSSHLVGGHPRKGRLLCVPRGAPFPGQSLFKENGVPQGQLVSLC